MILQSSASQVVRIAVVNHWCIAPFIIFKGIVAIIEVCALGISHWHDLWHELEEDDSGKRQIRHKTLYPYR
jgi:hypothetical protein